MSSGKEKFKSKIGGQAVIEGVMMRGIDKMAMANRLPDGSIDIDLWDIKGGKNVPWYRKTPFVRGIFNFVTSLMDGYKCISKSVDKQMTEEDNEEPSKFEQWLTDKLGDKMMPVLSGASMVLGMLMAVVLFMWLPSAVIKLAEHIAGSELNTVVKNIIEGLLKISIFVGYTALTALMPDMKRLYEYHGAEHKTIACYEAGKELTVDNVRSCSRFHPRCGTNFMFLMLFIAIILATIVAVIWPGVQNPRWLWILIKLCLIPLVMGFGYEIIRYAGKHDNWFARALVAPGMWMQRITTVEPGNEMMETAIAAFNAVKTDNPEDDAIR